jgi:hypothetical protein
LSNDEKLAAFPLGVYHSITRLLLHYAFTSPLRDYFSITRLLLHYAFTSPLRTVIASFAGFLQSVAIHVDFAFKYRTWLEEVNMDCHGRVKTTRPRNDGAKWNGLCKVSLKPL